MVKNNKQNTIEIYPNCPKPEWMALGEWCYVWGEAYDKFKVVHFDARSADLVHIGNGSYHGCESFTKLHRGS